MAGMFLFGGDFMLFNYDEEKETFLNELESGIYGIERISNDADKYRDKEARDEAVFKDYLQSASFKALDDEASKK